MISHKNRTIFFTLLLALVLLSSLAPAFAQQSGSPWGSSSGGGTDIGVFEPLKIVVTPIFNLFVKAGSLRGEELQGFTRFMVWLIIFSVVYTGIKVVPTFKENNNVCIVVSLALSAISAVFMPDWAVAQIGSSWGQIGFLLPLLVIFGGIIYAAVKTWDQPILSLALWLIALTVISYFNAVLAEGVPGDNRLSVDLPGPLSSATGILQPVFQIGGAVIGIAVIIQLFRALGGLAGRLGGRAAGGVSNWWGRRGGSDDDARRGGRDELPPEAPPTEPFPPEDEIPPAVLQEVERLQRDMAALQGNIAGLQNNLFNQEGNPQVVRDLQQMEIQLAGMQNILNRYLTLTNPSGAPAGART